jgi:hypothetical protein
MMCCGLTPTLIAACECGLSRYQCRECKTQTVVHTSGPYKGELCELDEAGALCTDMQVNQGMLQCVRQWVIGAVKWVMSLLS